jgi:hypothetical protein
MFYLHKLTCDLQRYGFKHLYQWHFCNRELFRSRCCFTCWKLLPSLSYVARRGHVSRIAVCETQSDLNMRWCHGGQGAHIGAVGLVPTWLAQQSWVLPILVHLPHTTGLSELVSSSCVVHPQIKHHARKGRGGKAHTFVTSVLGGGGCVSFMLWSPYPRAQSHFYSLNRRLGGPQSRFGYSGGEERYPWSQSV